VDNQLEKELNEKISLVAGNYQSMVNVPFDTLASVEIELGAVVLLLENTATKTIDRIALSETEPALGAVRASRKPFHEIKIPLTCKVNAIVRAINTGRKQTVANWKYLFTPELRAQEARDNQHGAGILCSIVSPLEKASRRGAIIFSFLCSAGEISKEHRLFIRTYTAAMSRNI
jgi:hypothetical protein